MQTWQLRPWPWRLSWRSPWLLLSCQLPWKAALWSRRRIRRSCKKIKHRSGHDMAWILNFNFSTVVLTMTLEALITILADLVDTVLADSAVSAGRFNGKWTRLAKTSRADGSIKPSRHWWWARGQTVASQKSEHYIHLENIRSQIVLFYHMYALISLLPYQHFRGKKIIWNIFNASLDVVNLETFVKFESFLLNSTVIFLTNLYCNKSGLQLLPRSFLRTDCKSSGFSRGNINHLPNLGK